MSDRKTISLRPIDREAHVGGKANSVRPYLPDERRETSAISVPGVSSEAGSACRTSLKSVTMPSKRFPFR